MASQESLLFSLDCKEEFDQMVQDTNILLESGFLDINTSFAALLISHLVTLGKIGVEEELKKLEIKEEEKEKYIIVHYIPNKDIQICLTDNIDYFGSNDMITPDNVEINQLKFDMLKEGKQLYDIGYRIHLHHALHITNKVKECQCYQIYEKNLKEKEEQEKKEKEPVELKPTKKVTSKKTSTKKSITV
jgi:hypothetical protein